LEPQAAGLPALDENPGPLGGVVPLAWGKKIGADTNTAIGQGVLSNNIGGSHNIAIGLNAGVM
jgi:hypothetical protein